MPATFNCVVEFPILKTKSNLTVFITEYFYSCFDLIAIKYFNWYPTRDQTDFMKDDIADDFTIELCVFSLKTKLKHLLTNS